MRQIELKDAEDRLAELIGLVAGGEQVIIKRSDGLTFKIIALASGKPCPKFGSAKGLIQMADDFDEPLEDFGEYMP